MELHAQQPVGAARRFWREKPPANDHLQVVANTLQPVASHTHVCSALPAPLAFYNIRQKGGEEARDQVAGAFAPE